MEAYRERLDRLSQSKYDENRAYYLTHFLSGGDEIEAEKAANAALFATVPLE